MSNKLIEIPIDKWSILLDMYINRKDRASCYNLLQTLINWKHKEPKFILNIFSLNDDWQTDGTFVAKFFDEVFFNTCGNNLQSLLTALNSLDSSTCYILAGYQDFLVPAVKQHFIDCGLGKELYKPTSCVWYHLPKEKAKLFSIDPPKNIQLKPLEEYYAEQINSVWPHRSPGSIEFVKLLLRQNDSVGLFDDGNLVAWCLILPLGALGLLQVIDSHKRRGLGNLAVRYMSKLLSEKDMEVTAPVVFTNTASRSMFEKLGFKIIDKVYWAVKPANK